QYPIRPAASAPHSAFAYVATVSQIFDQLKLAEKAAAIKLPTLLCYSTGDKIAPVTHGRILRKQIAAAQLMLVTQESHFTTLFAEAVEDEICRWVTHF